MTVIGVAEPGFSGIDVGEAAALWVPAMMKRQVTPGWDRLFDRRARWMHVFGRLKPGVTAESAKAGLQPWFKSVLESDRQLEGFPKTTPEQLRSFLASYLDVTPASHGRSNMRRAMEGPLWVLLAGTSLLVLLACSNVASLLLARGAARGREVVTRIALGASRGRITNQLLIESIVISLAGGLLGIAAAPAVSAALLSFLPAGRRAREPDLRSRHARPAVHIPCLHRDRRAVRQLHRRCRPESCRSSRRSASGRRALAASVSAVRWSSARSPSRSSF